jgi:hypothetical protein
VERIDMPQYVALMRAINVAGHARVSMTDVQKALVLCLPCATVVFTRAYRERWISRGALATVPFVTVIVHGPVLATFLRVVVLR